MKTQSMDQPISTTEKPVAGAVRAVAVIDIGSTAVRLSIAEIGTDGTVRPLTSLQRAVHLGKDTFTSGVIQPSTAAEVVSIAIEALAAAGASGISVDFTLPDLVAMLAAGALPLAKDAALAVAQQLDAKDAGGLVAAGGEAYLPLLYAAGPFEQAMSRLAGLAVGGALDGRIAALRAIAARVGAAARLTLDPTERHGFEYQSWFGFTIYAEGLRGSLGRGGTYRILGREGELGEAATGFSLYPDPLIDALASTEPRADMVFLPLGHDGAAAAALRAGGWRTLAALSTNDDPQALGCTHVLRGAQAVAL